MLEKQLLALFFSLKTAVFIYSLKKLISQLTLLDAYLIHELPFQSF